MTAQTPIYGIKYIVQGEPIKATRQALEDNARTIEAALQSRGVAPANASDVLAVSGRVTALETLPTCVVGSNATQGLGNGWTVAAWQTDIYDPDDMHNPAANTSRITIRKKGWYRLGGHVPILAGSAGILWCTWLKNGVAIPNTGQTRTVAAANGNGEALPMTHPLVQLNALDYVELRIGLTGAAGTWSTFAVASVDGIGPMLTIECVRLLP